MQKLKEENTERGKVIPLLNSTARSLQMISKKDDLTILGWQALNEIDDLLKDHFKEETAARSFLIQEQSINPTLLPSP